MVLSTASTRSLEDVAREFNSWSTDRGSLWFQLYIYEDRQLAKDLVTRAEAAGYRALCLTVDTPILGESTVTSVTIFLSLISTVRIRAPIPTMMIRWPDARDPFKFTV